MTVVTSYDHPPIPTRDMDWSAHFDWDDGGERLTGRGPTEEGAVIDLLQMACEADGDGSEQDEIIDLAIKGWLATKNPAHRFQNALRIMHSLDEISAVLAPDKVTEFHRDPFRAAIRMDEKTWTKVFALIDARQPFQSKPTGVEESE